MLDEIELGLDPRPTPPPPIGLVRACPGGDRARSRTHRLDDAHRRRRLRRGPLRRRRRRAARRRQRAAAPAAPTSPATAPTRALVRHATPARSSPTPTASSDERWYTLRENVGATEPADGTVSDDEAGRRARSTSSTTCRSPSQTVVRWEGAERIWATRLRRRPARSLPEDRPSNAFDGDPDTRGASTPRTIARALPRRHRPRPRRCTADHVDPRPAAGAGPARSGSPRRGGGARRRPAASRWTSTRTHAFDADGVRVRPRRPAVPAARGRADLASSRRSGRPASAEVEIPGVARDRAGPAARPPCSTASARRLADAPRGLRAQPAAGRPGRAGPGRPRAGAPAPARPPGARSPCTLSGTARLHDGADDAQRRRAARRHRPLRPLQPAPPRRSLGRAGVGRRRRRPRPPRGPPRSSASSTSGGRSTTGERVRVDEVELDVVADDRHSLPIRIGGVGRRRRRRRSCPFPRSSAGRSAQSATSPSPSRETLAGPDGPRHASKGPGPAPPPTGTATGRSRCRSPSPRSASRTPTRSSPQTRSTRAAATTCSPSTASPCPCASPAAPRTRWPGDGLDIDRLRRRAARARRRARTTCVAVPGAETGLDLDRLVLATPAWDGRRRRPPRARGGGHRPRTAVSSRASCDSDGDPFWLVVDQSVSDGWQLEATGADGLAATVDGPHPIDGNAVGWLVTPSRAGPLGRQRRLGAPAVGRPRRSASRRSPRSSASSSCWSPAAAGVPAPPALRAAAPGRRRQGRVAPEPARGGRSPRSWPGSCIHPIAARADRAGHGRVHLPAALGPVHPPGARRRCRARRAPAPGPRRPCAGLRLAGPRSASPTS